MENLQFPHDPVTHLSLTDIALDNKVSPSVIQVKIKQSKTDPFMKGVDIYLGRTGKDIICPIQAYLVIREHPLFVFSDGFLPDTTAFCFADHFYPTACWH